MENFKLRNLVLLTLMFSVSFVNGQEYDFPRNASKTVTGYNSGLSVQLAKDIKPKKMRKILETFEAYTYSLETVFNDLDRKNFADRSAYSLVHVNKATYLSRLSVIKSESRGVQLSFSGSTPKYYTPSPDEIKKILEYDEKLKKQNIKKKRYAPKDGYPEFVLLLQQKSFIGGEVEFPRIQKEILILQISEDKSKNYVVVGALNEGFFESQVFKTTSSSFIPIPQNLANKTEKNNLKITGDVEIPEDTDGDGISDTEDKCPKQYGSFESSGCPDADKDGVTDNDDYCPDVKGGEFGIKGCPDKDADGIPDKDDDCPTVAGGELGMNGCPPKIEDISVNEISAINSAIAMLEHALELTPGKQQLGHISNQAFSELFQADARIHYVNCKTAGAPEGSHSTNQYLSKLKNKGYAEIRLDFELDEKVTLENGDTKIYFIQAFEGFNDAGEIVYQDKTRKTALISKTKSDSDQSTYLFGSIKPAKCLD